MPGTDVELGVVVRTMFSLLQGAAVSSCAGFGDPDRVVAMAASLADSVIEQFPAALPSGTDRGAP